MLSLLCLIVLAQVAIETTATKRLGVLGEYTYEVATADNLSPRSGLIVDYARLDAGTSLVPPVEIVAPDGYLTLPSVEMSNNGTPMQGLSQDEFSFPTATQEVPWHAEDATLPATQFAMTSLTRLNQQGLGITSLDLRHTWLLGYDERSPLNITPGMGVHLWSGPQTLDLPPQVYDVYMDLQWQPWKGEKSALLIGATPGLYGDLKRIDNQTFQWSGWFIGSRQLGQRWTILGGVAYLRQLQSNWLPMGGAVWAPSDSTRAELVFPRPRLARRIHSTDRWTTWGYLAGQFGGGAWSVLDSPGQNVLVGYSDLRLVGGVEGFSRRAHEWRAEFGYVFARELRINSVLLEKPTDALLVQVTFAF